MDNIRNLYSAINAHLYTDNNKTKENIQKNVNKTGND